MERERKGGREGGREQKRKRVSCGDTGPLHCLFVYSLHNLFYEHTNTHRIFQTTLDGNILLLQPVYFTVWLLPFKQSPIVSVVRTGLFHFSNLLFRNPYYFRTYSKITHQKADCVCGSISSSNQSTAAKSLLGALCSPGPGHTGSPHPFCPVSSIIFPAPLCFRKGLYRQLRLAQNSQSCPECQGLRIPG